MGNTEPPKATGPIPTAEWPQAQACSGVRVCVSVHVYVCVSACMHMRVMCNCAYVGLYVCLSVVVWLCISV